MRATMFTFRWSTLTVLTVVLVLRFAGVASAADKVTLDKPVTVVGKKLDKSKFAGRVISYDDDGFEIRVKADETQTIEWKDLDAKTQYAVRNLTTPAKDAEAHVELGRAMLQVEGGKEFSEKAFATAIKLDPGLKDKVEQVKKEVADAPPTSKKKDSDKSEDMSGSKDGKPPEEEKSMRDAGPKMVGGANKKFWGPQTEEEQAAAVEELKQFAAKTSTTMKKNDLRLIETTYFLFYSDLDPQEAKNWSGLLDRMYGKLGVMFAVEKKVNIWRGKGLVFVFKAANDYRKFQLLMHDTDPGTSADVSRVRDGMVHIAFYRQPNQLEFAHVLVHESVHGFVHRYKTPVPVPSWVNEGLAEWISTQLLIDKMPNRPKEVKYSAQQGLRQYQGYQGMFEAEHIEGWQYPVSEMITTYMIERDTPGYVAFIKGIKEGLSVDESMEKRYKKSRERVVAGIQRGDAGQDQLITRARGRRTPCKL